MKKINLLITSFNRPFHLKRLLKFFLRYNVNEIDYYNILILDSSYSDIMDEELSNLIEKLKVKYLKFDSELFVVQKISNSLNLLEEDYSILLADDDIIDLKKYLEYREFLEKNHDYACITGIGLHDNFKHDLFFRNIESIVKENSIEQSNYKDRIKKYSSLLNVGNPFYGIVRTRLLKQVWHEMSKFVTFWYYPEIIHNYSLLIRGKFKVDKSLSGIRNFNEKLFNDKKSIEIMSYDRNVKTFQLLKKIDSNCDEDFIIQELSQIKLNLIEIISKTKNKSQFKTKEIIKKIIFMIFRKDLYYTKLDKQSLKFYNNVFSFYKINISNNLEIINSRKLYKKWIK